ncbi:MAG: hypothetical protein ACK5XN_10385 [Bacteroidota bacterium]
MKIALFTANHQQQKQGCQQKRSIDDLLDNLLDADVDISICVGLDLLTTLSLG